MKGGLSMKKTAHDDGQLVLKLDAAPIQNEENTATATEVESSQENQPSHMFPPDDPWLGLGNRRPGSED